MCRGLGKFDMDEFMREATEASAASCIDDGRHLSILRGIATLTIRSEVVNAPPIDEEQMTDVKVHSSVSLRKYQSRRPW